MPARKTKYNARGATVEGTKFDSQLEAECYLHFRAACKKLGIKLELQPEFELIPTQRPFKGCTLRRHTYTADFRIPMPEGEPDIVIDVKSTATADKRDYVINEKLMLFLKGIHVTRITSPDQAAYLMRTLESTYNV